MCYRMIDWIYGWLKLWGVVNEPVLGYTMIAVLEFSQVVLLFWPKHVCQKQCSLQLQPLMVPGPICTSLDFWDKLQIFWDFQLVASHGGTYACGMSARNVNNVFSTGDKLIIWLASAFISLPESTLKKAMPPPCIPYNGITQQFKTFSSTQSLLGQA